jgi:hypothetical protein
MKRTLLLAVAILLSGSVVLLKLAHTQKGDEVKLPAGSDFPRADANCKTKVKLSPQLSVLDVDSPNTFNCVMTIHTCSGEKEYKSGVRKANPTMCADYQKLVDELSNREICCDATPADCQRDEGALCEAIDRGTRLVKGTRVLGASSQVYGSLKQNLGQVLNRIRGELCEDTAAQAKVNELIKKLRSPNFVPGQSNLQNNLTLRRLEDGLNDLAVSECDVSRPTGETKPQP